MVHTHRATVSEMDRTRTRKDADPRPMLGAKFSAKTQNQAPCDDDDLKDASEERKTEKTITEAFKSGIWIVRDSILNWKINYGKTTTLKKSKD